MDTWFTELPEKMKTNQPSFKEFDDIWMIQCLHDRNLLHHSSNFWGTWNHRANTDAPVQGPPGTSRWSVKNDSRRLNTLQAVQGFLSSIHELDLFGFYLNNLHEGKKTASNLHPHYDPGLFFAILLMARFASLSTRWTWQPFSAVKGGKEIYGKSQNTPRSHSEIACSFVATLLITSRNRCFSTSKDTSRANKNLIKKNPTNPTIQPSAPNSKASLPQHPPEPSSPTRWLWRPAPSHLHGSLLG